MPVNGNGHGAKPVQPLVGIPSARDRSTRYFGLSIYIQNRMYVQGVTHAGGAPITIPLELEEDTLRTIYDSLDAVFLPGGEDIDPSRYHEDPHELLGAVDKERDRTEFLLASWAMAENKPILAICRGAQVMNVAAGGSLYQDITAQRPNSEKHDYFPPQFERFRLSHEVEVDTGSRLHELMGPHGAVNSMHHQAVKDLAPTLRAVAWAPDGVVEAVEVAAHPFALGIQWHPEELAPRDDPGMIRVFRAFVETARQTHATRR
jgi:putative glutamine amidotransferase